MNSEKICECLKSYQKERNQHFLNICSVLKEFSHRKSEMRLRGFNDFNYFELLSGQSKENAHSKIIAEFLNPYGSHYQGNLFLDNFFELIDLSELKQQSWQAYIEYFTDDNAGKGQGRIDIALESEDAFIIVENKIYAGEQEAQIYKYVEDIRTKHRKIYVLYLTLNGDDPSSKSLDMYKIKEDSLYDNNDGEVANYYTISYSKILEWMYLNLSVVENISNLREAIKQYIKILEKLLGKDDNIMNLKDFLLQEENKEILVDLIENKDDFIEYIKDDRECKKIVMQENLDDLIWQLKLEIREKCVKELEIYLQKEKKFDNAIRGHYDIRDKMAYMLFTSKKYGYILFFDNKNILNLKLGKINCSECKPKNINCIKNKCQETHCWDVIKTQKCFNIKDIDSFDSIELYRNYVLSKSIPIKIKEKIYNSVQDFETE